MASFRRVFGALFGAAMLACTPASGAEITRQQSGNIAVIFVSGTLESGDQQAFVQQALAADRAVVVLDSPGGNLLAGIEIGKAIRMKGFATYVPGGQACASACALAWLGGIKRFADGHSRIGFHAAYHVSGGAVTESGMANALVGAYLNQLGLSEAAIAYLTSAPPDGMEWLHMDQANAVGIAMVMLSDDETAAVTQPRQSGSASPPEGEVTGLLRSYHEIWSDGGEVSFDFVSEFYARNVIFYGNDADLGFIYSDKLKFSKRWPARSYVIKPGSMEVDCFSPDDCHASFIVEFDVSSAARGKSASGLSRSFLSVHRFSEGWKITQETSEVIQRD